MSENENGKENIEEQTDKPKYDPEKDETFITATSGMDPNRPSHKRFIEDLKRKREKHFYDSQLQEELEINTVKDVLTKMPKQMQAKIVRLLSGFINSLVIYNAFYIKELIPNLNDYWSGMIAICWGFLNSVLIKWTMQIDKNSQVYEKQAAKKTIEEQKAALAQRRLDELEKADEVRTLVEAEKLRIEIENDTTTVIAASQTETPVPNSTLLTENTTQDES